ncbi:hypothetical protein ACWEQC_46200 [Streptomyces shenzhenensis]|uniref:hypothetical protein n=1 Tax=Streptomyces sp. NPDC102462 TaxID=3366178 RepID=UPI0037F6C314
MGAFAVGDTVTVTGKTMTGNVGIVIHIDEAKNRYLVRISAVTQNWFTADELKPYEAGSGGRIKAAANRLLRRAPRA